MINSNATLPPRHILSKSTFMRGSQCAKSLWLYKNQPDLRDEMSVQQANIFSTGTSVGELARQLFPGGVDASPATTYEYQQSVADTAAYIASGHKIIYEAAFQYNGVLAALDILVRKNGRWYGYEVKSSTQVKPQFVEDAALQYYVINGAGLALADISVVHINNQYVRKGELDIPSLFNIVSVMEEVTGMQEQVSEKVEVLKKIAVLKDVPEIAVGKHCTKPYDCDFYGHCWKDVEEEIKEGIENTDHAELSAFLEELEYPLYFMDFETYMVAVPEYDGHWPYRQVPFQFSVHRQDAPGAECKHEAFLAPHNCNPCDEFVERLIEAAGKKGSIIVYNKTFENCRLNELIDDYPKYEKQLQSIQRRLVDLMVPFRKKHLSLPSMNGSYSIKAVLPALVPELSYADLEIGNGGDASSAYYNLRSETDAEKVNSVRDALLKYCELDTWAMVRILEKVSQIV